MPNSFFLELEAEVEEERQRREREATEKKNAMTLGKWKTCRFQRQSFQLTFFISLALLLRSILCRRCCFRHLYRC